MTAIKTAGRILLWVVRLGIFLLGPTMLWLAGRVFYGPFTPERLGPTLLVVALGVAAIYIGWRCDLAFPIERPQNELPQTDSPHLASRAGVLAAVNALVMAILLGLTWIHSAGAANSSQSGANLYFVPEMTFSFCVASALFLWLGCFVLWLIGQLKNARQLRFLSWMMVLTIGIFPVVVAVIDRTNAHKGPPLWEIRRTTTGPDNETYFFLRAGQMRDRFLNDSGGESPDKFSAVARRTGGNLFFSEAEIVLSDMQSPQGALLQGKKHSDPTVRQVSEKLLKAQSES